MMGSQLLKTFCLAALQAVGCGNGVRGQQAAFGEEVACTEDVFQTTESDYLALPEESTEMLFDDISYREDIYNEDMAGAEDLSLPKTAWVEIGLPFPKDFVFKGLWAAGQNAVFVVGAGPIAYFYNGTEFIDLKPPSFTPVLNSVWGTDEKKVIAVGMYGSALWWDAEAQAWSDVTAPELPTLFGVSGQREDSIFAVGLGGTILRWDGQTWQRSAISGQRVFRGVCSDPSSGLWVVGSGGTILHLKEGRFVEVPAPVNADLNGCAAGIIAGSSGYVLKAQDGGVVSLGSVTYSDLFAVTSLPNGRAWAVGKNGQVVELNPDGTVTLYSIAAGKDLYGVHATSDFSVWAVGKNGTAVRYNGTMWILRETGVDKDLYGFYAVGAAEGLAVGQGGTALLLHGGNFAKVETGTERDLFGVIMLSSQEGFAVGEQGTILYWKGVFEPVQSPTDQDLYSVVSDPSGRLWACGDRVIVVRGEDGVWRVALNTVSEDLFGVYALDEDHAYAVGKGGAVYALESGNWVRIKVPDLVFEDGTTMPFTKALYGVWAYGPQDFVAVGEQGMLVRSTKGGVDIIKLDSDVTLRSVHGTGPKSFFAVGSKGTVYHFDGASYEREPTATVATLFSVFAVKDGPAYAAGDTGVVLMRR